MNHFAIVAYLTFILSVAAIYNKLSDIELAIKTPITLDQPETASIPQEDREFLKQFAASSQASTSEASIDLSNVENSLSSIENDVREIKGRVTVWGVKITD